MKTEAERIRQAIPRVLERLREGPATNNDLSTICQRFGARIFLLRKGGYKIKTEQVEIGLYRYTLLAEPQRA